MFDFLGGLVAAVKEDIDGIDRALGVTPYRWRVYVVSTEEIVERELAFGSAERAFYNAQDFLLSRLRNKTSSIFDEVELTISNSRTGEQVDEVAKRHIGPGHRYSIGYMVAEQLGYEI